MYQHIVKCNEHLVDTTPIDIVVPSGTAIQNLRNYIINATLRIQSWCGIIYTHATSNTMVESL